jgi:hypothetical protein
MQQKPFRFGPLALTNSAANILNPGTCTGGVNSTSSPYGNLRIILTHIRLVNKTAGAVTATLYIGLTGGTAAGSEFAFNGYSIPANSYTDFYGRVPLDVADYLVGLASANTSISIEGEGEIGVG